MTVEPSYGHEGDRFQMTVEPSYGRERVKKDSIISSSLSMAKIARSQSSGKGKSSSSSSGASGSWLAGPSWYSSPLDCPCSSSTHGKRSASPGRGSGGKRSWGGRGGSPSPKSRQGFRK